jgi:hypothetical protein
MMLFEISKGEQVLEFSDYMMSDHLTPKNIPNLKLLGVKLFTDGWTFRTVRHGQGAFKKGPFQIAMPSPSWLKDLQTVVISYKGAPDPKGYMRYGTTRYKCKAVIEDLEGILKEVEEDAS